MRNVTCTITQKFTSDRFSPKFFLSISDVACSGHFFKEGNFPTSFFVEFAKFGYFYTCQGRN